MKPSIADSVRRFVETQETQAAAAGQLTADLNAQPLSIDNATLHQHQLAGLNWIKSRYEQKINCLLADEMGLGKTLQAIAFLAYLRDHHSLEGPFLIVCPLTVVEVWMKEFENYCPCFTTKAYIGEKSERGAFQQEINQFVLAQPKAKRKDPDMPFNVLVTTYDMVSKDKDFLARLKWRAIIVDEAHRLKNENSVLYDTLTRAYITLYRLLLTGTPCQNNIDELWALLHFLAPNIFVSKSDFHTRFASLQQLESKSVSNSESKPKSAPPSPSSVARQPENIAGEDGACDDDVDDVGPRASIIDRKVKSLRKLNPSGTDAASPSASSSSYSKPDTAAGKGKGIGGASDDGDANDASDVSDVATELHDVLRPFMLRRMKDEVNLKLPPKREMLLYCGMSDMQKKYYKFILTKNALALGAGNARGLVNIISSLRKCCNHPYLFKGAEPEPFTEGDHIFTNSGKFFLLDKLLPVLKKKGRRVLIFSTSVQTLDVLQDYLSYRHFSYERLDGSVRGEERYLAIERFKQDATFVFLLSTRAGGVGLNLTVADTVIFMDSDWNPQIDLQAQARVHRIGQKKPVLVLRLMCANTVEEVIQRRTAQKLKMWREVIEKGHFALTQPNEDDMVGASGASELRDILQFGLDRVWDSVIKDLSVKDIEMIIEGRQQQSSLLSQSVSLASIDQLAANLDDPQSSQPQSMYIYEGTDYKNYQADHESDVDSVSRKQKTAAFLDQLVQDAGGAPSGGDGAFDTPVLTRKRKAEESPADRAQRQAKAQKQSADRALAAKRNVEERAAKKADQLKQLRVDNNYNSTSIQLVGDASNDQSGDEQDNEWTIVQDEKGNEDAIAYMVGDASMPDPPASGSEGCMVINCVDDSGSWGRGGFFRALDKLSVKVGQAYEWAAENQDLHLGDAHLVLVSTITPTPSAAAVAELSGLSSSGAQHVTELDRDTPEDDTQGWTIDVSMADDVLPPAPEISPIPPSPAPLSSAPPPARIAPYAMYVCHVVAQHRKKGSAPSGIQLEHLTAALKKACQAAVDLKLTVHLPRIGAGTPNFNWYGIEKVVKRYLVGRHVPTTVYYYKQRGQYRSPVKQMSRVTRLLSTPSSVHTSPHSASNLFGASSDDLKTTPVQTPTKVPHKGGANASKNLATPPSRSPSARSPSATPSSFLSPSPVASSFPARTKPTARSRSRSRSPSPSSSSSGAKGRLQPTPSSDSVSTSLSPDPESLSLPPLSLPSQSSLSDSSQELSQASRESENLHMLCDVFSGLVFYLDRVAPQELRMIKRYISAYDGELEGAGPSGPSSLCTHIVTSQPYVDLTLRQLRDKASAKVLLVSPLWVEACIKNRRVDRSSVHQIGEAPIFTGLTFFVCIPDESNHKPTVDPFRKFQSERKRDALWERLQVRGASIATTLMDPTLTHVLVSDLEPSMRADILKRTVSKGVKVVTTSWLDACVDATAVVDIIISE